MSAHERERAREARGKETVLAAWNRLRGEGNRRTHLWLLGGYFPDHVPEQVLEYDRKTLRRAVQDLEGMARAAGHAAQNAILNAVGNPNVEKFLAAARLARDAAGLFEGLAGLTCNADYVAHADAWKRAATIMDDVVVRLRDWIRRKHEASEEERIDEALTQGVVPENSLRAVLAECSRSFAEAQI